MTVKIETYKFGEITIRSLQKGKVILQKYTTDIIITKDKVYPNWWRINGHSLVPEDLSVILAERPKMLIIGNGYSSCMQVPRETVEFLDERGISVIVENTQKAVEIFNEKVESNLVVAGCFHLTC